MLTVTTHDFDTAINQVQEAFRNYSKEVHPKKWQGVNVEDRPEMTSYELQNVVISVPMIEESLQYYRDNIQPNIPWADDHFVERVSGQPLNPGETWKTWPWASSADKFRENHIFNHTYMERYWPRHAGHTDAMPLNWGIRGPFGDLDDLIKLLATDPLTRQAWIPIFFPEDTGIGDGGRKPCTLGYQFILRDNELMVYYPIRSCDFIRHFRDDIYLTVRLLLWILDQLRERDKTWGLVKPGEFVMHCTSLHIFKNDMIALFGKEKDNAKEDTI